MVKRPKTSPFHGGNPGSSPGGVTKIQVSANVLTCIFLCPTSGTRGEARQEMPQGGGINRRQNSGQPLFSVRRSQAESPGGVTKMQVSTSVLTCIFFMLHKRDERGGKARNVAVRQKLQLR